MKEKEKSQVIHVRIDNDLHRRLAELSKKDGRTLSGFVVWIVKKFCGVLK